MPDTCRYLPRCPLFRICPVFGPGFVFIVIVFRGLQSLVDLGSFNPAVELSYLTPEEQKDVIEAMDFTQAAPSLSQAMRLKKLSQEGGCKLDDMCEILGEIKKGDLERVAFKSEQLRKYLPKSYTPRQMSDVILKLLDQWQKKRQRDKAR